MNLRLITQIILNNSLTYNSILAYFNVISFHKNTLKETICLIKIQQAFSSAGTGLISDSFILNFQIDYKHIDLNKIKYKILLE